RSASRITRARRVSTETGTGASRKASSNGRMRASSSSSETGAAPGRVDSPPMSSRSAPSAMSLRACASAAAGSRYCPPSENESGVTLTTPMTNGRTSSSSWRPHFSFKRSGGGCGCGRAVRVVFRRRGWRLRGSRLGWTRRLAGQDVVELIGVERLQLEQRLCHRFDDRPVVLDQLARQLVLRIDDVADLLIHFLQRRLGHVLVRGDRAAEEDFALVLAVHHRA